MSDFLVYCTILCLTYVLFIGMQVKVNKTAHTCPSVNRRQRLRSAKSRWIADAIKNWVQEAMRGASPAKKKKLSFSKETTIGSVTGSNQLSKIVPPQKELKKIVNNRRISSRLSTNPACNTRSKRVKLQ